MLGELSAQCYYIFVGTMCSQVHYLPSMVIGVANITVGALSDWYQYGWGYCVIN